MLFFLNVRFELYSLPFSNAPLFVSVLKAVLHNFTKHLNNASWYGLHFVVTSLSPSFRHIWMAKNFWDQIKSPFCKMKAYRQKGRGRVLRTIIKIYLKIMVFLTNLINFHWIFTCRLQKSDFSNFSNFCIFAARCKKNCCKPFGLWILIFIRSNDRAHLPRKWTARIFDSVRYFYLKFPKNYLKLHISVKSKILPEGRYKTKAEGECFAPWVHWTISVVWGIWNLMFLW